MFLLSVPNITCGHCLLAVTEAIHQVDPAAIVQIDLVARTVAIDNCADIDVVREKLDAEGYPASVV